MPRDENALRKPGFRDRAVNPPRPGWWRILLEPGR